VEVTSPEKQLHIQAVVRVWSKGDLGPQYFVEIGQNIQFPPFLAPLISVPLPPFQNPPNSLDISLSRFYVLFKIVLLCTYRKKKEFHVH